MDIKNKKYALVILNYNGRDLLEECLPSIVDAAQYDGINAEVMLLDNVSNDDSVSFVREKFKDVHIEVAKTNNFLFSYNNILKKLSCDYVILMNNDVIVTRDFIMPLLEHFNDPDVFAVGPRIYNIPENKPFKGKMTPNFGRFRFSWTYNPDIQNACFTFTVLGAAMAIDRKKFIELGGFDELFQPGYMEDSDICYRAWKRGWKAIYEPKSVVYHKWRVSMRKAYGEKRLKRICQRNIFLFIWKNISSFSFIVLYCFLLPLRLLRAFFHGNTDFIVSFFMAIRRLPIVIKRGIKDDAKGILTNKEIERAIVTGIFPAKGNKIANKISLKSKINRILYMLACAAVYLPARVINTIDLKTFNLKNIDGVVIFAGGGIGNLIMLQPFLKSVRENWKNAELTLLVPLLGMKDLSKILIPEANVHLLPPGKWGHFFRVWGFLKKEFSRTSYPICFSTFLNRNNQSSWVSKFLIGAKVRVGFILERILAPWQNISLKFDENQHEIDINLDMLRHLGIEPSAEDPHMVIPQHVKNWSEDYISGLNPEGDIVIGIHPGSAKSCKGKRWPVERFINLIKELLVKHLNYTILVFIGPDDKDIGDEIAREINAQHLRIIEESDIINVSGLIEQCGIFISNDSGLMHIADVLGIPLVVIWGPTSFIKNRPLNKSAIVIKKDLPCAPCYKVGKEIECQHRLCLMQIKVAEVMEACEELLKRLKNLKEHKQEITTYDLD